MPNPLPSGGVPRLSSLLLALVLTGGLALVACGPGDPVQAIRDLHAKGHYEESLEPLRELLETRPEDPEVQFLYGVALHRTGQPSLALWSLREASRQSGWEVPAGLEFAASAYQSHNYPVAVEEAARVLEIESDNRQALRLRAEAQLAERSGLEKALADFDRLIELDPDNLDVRVSRAAALLLMKRVEEADAALEELARRAKDEHMGEATRAQYCVARATFAKERGDRELAEERYEACLGEFPENSTVLRETVVFYDEQGRPGRGTELLRQAVEQRPQAVELRDALARRLRLAGKPEEAETVLRGGTTNEVPAAAAFAWRALADHFIAVGQNDRAAEALEKALEIDPHPSQQLLLAFADLLVAAGHPERAREVAAGLKQDFLRDLIEARILLEQRRPREAIAHFESAFRYWPDNAAARYYTARAAEAVGDFERAIAEYRQSIRAGAEYTDAGLRLARLYEAQGDWRPALGALAHQTKAHGESPETRLFEMRLRAHTGEAARVRTLLREMRHPATWAQAVAFVADITATRQGPEAAVEVVREDPRLDLTRPRDAAALRALVTQLLAAGRADEALAAVDAALAAHPDAAVFHEIRGLALERRDEADAARSAYRRAVELAPANERALAGLARLAVAAGDVAAAVDLYDRAAAADPAEAAPAREAAVLLARSGNPEEAERRLADLLWNQPYDAEAAMALAELRLDRGAARGRTPELVERAARFGGGPRVEALRERLAQATGAKAVAEAPQGGAPAAPQAQTEGAGS